VSCSLACARARLLSFSLYVCVVVCAYVCVVVCKYVCVVVCAYVCIMVVAPSS